MLILLGVSESICFDSGHQFGQEHTQLCHQIHAAALTSTTLLNPCQSRPVRPALEVTRVPGSTTACFQVTCPLTSSSLFLIFPYLVMGFFNKSILAPALLSGWNVFLLDWCVLPHCIYTDHNSVTSCLHCARLNNHSLNIPGVLPCASSVQVHFSWSILT